MNDFIILIKFLSNVINTNLPLKRSTILAYCFFFFFLLNWFESDPRYVARETIRHFVTGNFPLLNIETLFSERLYIRNCLKLKKAEH